MLDLLLSIIKENMKKITTLIALAALFPSAFFVFTNLAFYSLTNLGMPSGMRTLNHLISFPAIILTSIFTATLLSTYSVINGSIKIEKNTLTVKYLGINKNFVALAVGFAAIATMSTVLIYLFAENIGF